MLALRCTNFEVQKREAENIGLELKEEVSGKKQVPSLARLSCYVKKRTTDVLDLDCLVRW